MSRIEKLSLVYEFGNYAIDKGITENKGTCRSLVYDFIQDCEDNLKYADDADDLLWFEQDVESLEQAKQFLYDFLGV